MDEDESSNAVTNPGEPSDGVAPEAAPVVDGIDPDDERVVPTALSALVTAARQARAAMAGNGTYAAQVAVAAVQEVVAALAPMTRDLEAYAGDYSKQAEKHLITVTGLLEEARANLGHARTELEVHEASGSDTPPIHG